MKYARNVRKGFIVWRDSSISNSAPLIQPRAITCHACSVYFARIGNIANRVYDMERSWRDHVVRKVQIRANHNRSFTF